MDKELAMTDFEAENQKLKQRVAELTAEILVPCHECKRPAVWKLEWADRESYICSELACMRKAQHHHDFDHTYDQIKGGPFVDTWWAQNAVLVLPKRPEIPHNIPRMLPDLFAFLYPGAVLRVPEEYKVEEYNRSCHSYCKKCGCLVLNNKCVDPACGGTSEESGA